jgi:predicted NAD/FAD-binding protein
MNEFYPNQNWDGDLFQTIMPIETADPAKVVSNVFMQRPVVNQQSLAATKQIRQFHTQKDRRVWFCGSYASDGVPLLESGVVSSLNVATHLGFGWPEDSPLCHA